MYFYNEVRSKSNELISFYNCLSTFVFKKFIFFFVVANDLVILCNKDPSFFFEGSPYILYITSNGIVNILKTSLPQQFLSKGWYLSCIWEIFTPFCNFISIHQVRKELILHGQPFLCKQLKCTQMRLLSLAFPALGLFLQWDSKFSRDEFYCFLQIPCVMWILKLKTLCVSIYVHGYECVESYAHVYVEAGFKFKYCFSSSASHCFFSFSFWERMKDNDGAQAHRRFREEGDGTKESFQASMRDLVIFHTRN